MSEQQEWEFRLAVPDDSEAFANWVVDNPYIDSQDVQDGLWKNNPTTITFVICHHGVPVIFAPMYVLMHLAHLGINPESGADERKEGLERLMKGVGAFAVQMGVRTITTLTKERYPVARWAKAHGFEFDSRNLWRWDLVEWLRKRKCE